MASADDPGPRQSSARLKFGLEGVVIDGIFARDEVCDRGGCRLMKKVCFAVDDGCFRGRAGEEECVNLTKSEGACGGPEAAGFCRRQQRPEARDAVL